MFFDRLVANALGSQLTPGGVGLYRARNRTYSPTLGRWLQRDPNATAQPVLEAAPFNGLAFSDFALRMDVPTLYGDGMNLYQFGRSNPIANGDPMGLYSYGEQMSSTAIRGLLLGALVGGPAVGARVGGTVSAWQDHGFLPGAYQGASFGFVGGIGFLFGFGVGAVAGFGPVAAGSVGGATGGMASNAWAGGGEAGDGIEAALIGAATGGMLGLLGDWLAESARTGIIVTNRGLSHVMARHMPGGAQTAGKSVFEAGENVFSLARTAESVTPVAQPAGNLQRIVDAGRAVGVDRATGQSTSTYTVITNRGNELVTMFPGRP